MHRTLHGLFALCLTASVAFGADEGNPDPRRPLPLLVRSAKVAEVVRLTDKQAQAVAKLLDQEGQGKLTAPRATELLMAELKDDQYRRVREISWQLRGGSALADPDLRSELAVDEKQAKLLDTLWAAGTRKLETDLARVKFRTPADQRGFIAMHLDGVGAEMEKVLTADQVKAFTKLKGKAVELTADAWGGK